MTRKDIGLPENDPAKARAAALENLQDRMGDTPPEVVKLALQARNAAVMLVQGNGPAASRLATITETVYLDAKYGYGIRPWLPVMWAGWKPEIPTE